MPVRVSAPNILFLIHNIFLKPMLPDFSPIISMSESQLEGAKAWSNTFQHPNCVPETCIWDLSSWLLSKYATNATSGKQDRKDVTHEEQYSLGSRRLSYLLKPILVEKWVCVRCWIWWIIYTWLLNRPEVIQWVKMNRATMRPTWKLSWRPDRLADGSRARRAPKWVHKLKVVSLKSAKWKYLTEGYARLHLKHKRPDLTVPIE